MSIKRIRTKGKFAVLLCALLFASALFIGCDDGDDGKPGSSAGTLSGMVTVEGTSIGIPDVTISTVPDIQGDITTDGSGNYSATLPIGVYQVTYTRDNFGSATETVSIVADANVVRDVELSGEPVVVLASAAPGTVNPGDPVSLTATVEALDGSTVQTILWEQSSSAPVQDINPPDALATTVTLGDLNAYRDELFTVLTEPPITEAQLPPNIELPEGGFVGGLQDRFQVVGLDPFSLEEAALVTMKVTVTTSSGTYHDEVEIHATLPWKVTRGVNSVPIGVPVLMHGGTKEGTQAAWDWTLTAPFGSSAALDDGTLQNPTFTPDATGTYTLTEANSSTSIDVYAGNWEGAITGQDGNGRPLAADCTAAICHAAGGLAPDTFTDWKETGHAEIFSVNLNTSTHYGASCFPCHTVGYDTEVSNNGIDDQNDYQAFLDAGLLNNPGDNWTTMLVNFDESAQLANIQCENCHGPQGAGHTLGAPRVSLASEVCASCHGEPLRHARFQQWQLSHHANYETAIAEGDSGNCSRCHTANGFLEWVPVLIGDVPGDPEADIFSCNDVTLLCVGGPKAGADCEDPSDPGEPDSALCAWDEDERHPQTCVTCHDPHAIGTTTGTGTDATTRIFDDTPVLAAGWSASGVGNGAICMTCHNTRRGLVNDAEAAADNIDFSQGRAPHGGAQGDMVMGQNAFFVQVGVRGPHSLIDDTCVNCHMETTPPPALLSYNQGGSNHTFAASIDICSECHASINGEAYQAAIEADLLNLISAEEAAIEDLMTTVLASADVTLTEYEDDTGTEITVPLVISSGTAVSVADFAESHGRMSMQLTIDPAGTPTVVHVQLRRIETGGANLFDSFVEGQTIIKTGWNILMIENDGCLGVHNPPFTTAILGATTNVMASTDFTTATPVP